MEIEIFRDEERPGVTLGTLWIDGVKICETLEDEHNEPKIPGKTRIPAGMYDVKLRTHSPMANRYRERFGDEHAGMIWLQNVPGFSYVYIHVGNDEDDTDGCPLVGLQRNGSTISNSVKAYNLFWKSVIAAVLSGDWVTCTVHDRIQG